MSQIRVYSRTFPNPEEARSMTARRFQNLLHISYSSPLQMGSIFIMLPIVMTAFCMRGQGSCVHFFPKSLDGEKQHLEPVQRRLRTISSLTDQQSSDPCVAQRSWTLSLMRDWIGPRGPLPCGGTECILPMRESRLRV